MKTALRINFKDPSFEDLQTYITQNFSGLFDKETLQYDLPVAIYWLGYSYHSGQNSQLYKALCQSGYTPSILSRGIESENECCQDIYSILVNYISIKR